MWKILVVDDDFANRKLIIELLADYAQCDAAACGQEALVAFTSSLQANKPYDVILLDVSMPDIDGIEVLKKIREMEEIRNVPLGSGVPVIMVTAHKMNFMKSFVSGCDDFILKPIEGAKMIKKINEILGKRPTVAPKS